MATLKYTGTFEVEFELDESMPAGEAARDTVRRLAFPHHVSAAPDGLCDIISGAARERLEHLAYGVVAVAATVKHSEIVHGVAPAEA